MSLVILLKIVTIPGICNRYILQQYQDVPQWYCVKHKEKFQATPVDSTCGEESIITMQTLAWCLDIYRGQQRGAALEVERGWRHVIPDFPE